MEAARAEFERLEALRSYGILDTPNEPEFDRIVRDAASFFGTPSALISLIDSDRQWFKAKVGVEASETPLAMSFCTHAIRSAEVTEVPDATLDDRFADNPSVTGEPFVRFYAGAPLRTPAGKRIGTICVFDQRPHERLTASQVSQLQSLADRTIATFEARRNRAAAIA